MNISDIPIASNYARDTSGKLIQHIPGGEKTSTFSGSGHGETKFCASLCSSDNDYTREDAVQQKWMKQFSFNLFDELEGKDTFRAPRPLAGEERTAFEKALQAAGPSKEMEWGNLSYDFRGIGFSASKSASWIKEGDFSRKLDYITSRYAAAEDKILKNYAGGERQEQMDKLKEMYGGALDQLAESYAAVLGNALEENGVSGEAEKISASVRSAAAQKVDGYRESLSNHAGLAALKETKDAWLLGDDEYVASVLRGESSVKAAKTAPKEAEKAPYTLRDLDVLERYAAALSNAKLDEFSESEEEIGLDFAMLDMKTSALRKSGTVSSAMDATLDKLVRGYKNAALERMEETLSSRRKQKKIAADVRGFAGLDRKSVWSVHARVMEEFQRSGDAIKSLLAGVSFGRQQRNQKISSGQAEGIYRYTNNDMFWNHFDKATSGSVYGYRPSTTPFAQFRSGWDDFNASISQDHVRLNLTRHAADILDPYYTGIPNFTVTYA